jgi:hypothetical protein
MAAGQSTCTSILRQADSMETNNMATALPHGTAKGTRICKPVIKARRQATLSERPPPWASMRAHRPYRPSWSTREHSSSGEVCFVFPVAPAFRSQECHSIRPCTVVSLPLTEARLRNSRTSLFTRTFTASGCVAPGDLAWGEDVAWRSDGSSPR